MRDEHESKTVTDVPDVLTDHEIRRVFPIIKTTRHAERNRLLSCCRFIVVYGLGRLQRSRLGIVATDKREVRQEIKLGAHHIKGPKAGRLFCRREFATKTPRI
jgi:hypothetical protein